MKLCLGCNKLTRNSRCAECQATQDRARESRRGKREHYDAEWRRISKAAIAAQPWCSICGSTEDLTTDHIKARSLEAGVRVLCRSHNSSKGKKEDR